MMGMRFVLAIGCLCWFLTGCSASGAAEQSTPPPGSAICEVTRPSERADSPPPEVAESSGRAEMLYGQGGLWVALPTPDVDVVKKNDGTYGLKFMWWRLDQGNLKLQATLKGSESRRVEGDVPTGYGDVGFQASGIDFPEAGCWEVVGSLNDIHVAFTVEIP